MSKQLIELLFKTLVLQIVALKRVQSENRIPDCHEIYKGFVFAVETFPVLVYFYVCYAPSRGPSLESKWWI
jgi:hypothetical protein